MITGIGNVRTAKSFSSSMVETSTIRNNGSATSEVVSFPSTAPGNEMKNQPILLDSKEHAVGYLNRILNARVYEAAIETELQHAKNLSTVSQIRRIANGIPKWYACRIRLSTERLLLDGSPFDLFCSASFASA